MNTHTPGPWELTAGRTFKTQSGTFYISYGKDVRGNALFRDFVELDNNARLIAAAPDLLAACEAAKEALIALRGDRTRISLESLEQASAITALNILRAAIAKAS